MGDAACVCEQKKGNIKFVDVRGAYCAVFEESLPHVCGEASGGGTGHVGRHNGVIYESWEVRTHCRKVTAVCQPWLTMQFVIEEAKARHKICFQIECEGIFQGIHYGSVTVE